MRSIMMASVHWRPASTLLVLATTAWRRWRADDDAVATFVLGSAGWRAAAGEKGGRPRPRLMVPALVSAPTVCARVASR